MESVIYFICIQKYIIMEISIKKPCQENWETMTPNEAGAFCGKCIKTVIDFSDKSLDDIKSFFEQKQSEKVCGRFQQKQLVSLSFDSFFEEFKNFAFTKRFAVILYFTFGMWLFETSSGIAQTQTHLKGDVEVKSNPIMGGVRAFPQKDTVQICEKPKQSPKLIKGKVAVKQKQVEEIRMGEVMAEPPKRKMSEQKKPTTKE